nr:hypothetical protein GCM10020063_089070 [Dactylosporangium thailandense]
MHGKRGSGRLLTVNPYIDGFVTLSWTKYEGRLANSETPLEVTTPLALAAPVSLRNDRTIP